MIRQAVIPAGGFGTRLRPYTDAVPKPMVRVLGKPMLEWRIGQFRKYGVSEFFLTLNYLPEVVVNYFGDGSKFGVKINYFFEDQPLGTAGALKKMSGQLDALFFYGYGDVLAFIDYKKMQEAYVGKKNPIGMQHTQRSEDYRDADVVEIDADGKYFAIHPKPHAESYVNPVYRMQGTLILDKKITAFIPDGIASDLGRDILPKILVAGKNFYAYESDEEVVWVDTAEKLHEVEAYLTQKRQIDRRDN